MHILIYCKARRTN